MNPNSNYLGSLDVHNKSLLKQVYIQLISICMFDIIMNKSIHVGNLI